MSENDRNGQESRQNAGQPCRQTYAFVRRKSSGSERQKGSSAPRSASGQSTGTARKSSGTSGQTCIGTASVTRAATRSGTACTRSRTFRNATSDAAAHGLGRRDLGRDEGRGQGMPEDARLPRQYSFDDTAHRRCRRNNNGLCVPILCQ